MIENIKNRNKLMRIANKSPAGQDTVGMIDHKACMKMLLDFDQNSEFKNLRENFRNKIYTLAKYFESKCSRAQRQKRRL